MMKFISTCVDSVVVARPTFQWASSGSNLTSTLHALETYAPKDILVKPIPTRTAKIMCEQRHYLGSYPASPLLNLGIFVGARLLGVCVIGCGPAGIRHLFEGAEGKHVACLSRLWLSDLLGKNSESRTLSVILRQLRRNQNTIKTLVAYSDPAAGHDGSIYRAANFLYLGRSSSSRLYRLPDGSLHHSRTLSHIYGTHSMRFLASRGLKVEAVPQQQKHTYVALIDPAWRNRLTRPVLPYSTINSEE